VRKFASTRPPAAARKEPRAILVLGQSGADRGRLSGKWRSRPADRLEDALRKLGCEKSVFPPREEVTSGKRWTKRQLKLTKLKPVRMLASESDVVQGLDVLSAPCRNNQHKPGSEFTSGGKTGRWLGRFRKKWCLGSLAVSD